MMLNRLALVGLGLIATASAAMTANADNRSPAPRPPGRAIGPEGSVLRVDDAPAPASRPRSPTPRERFDALREDRDAAREAFDEAKKKAKPEAVGRAFDDAEYADRLLAVAEAHPDDPATGEALIWIVSRGAIRPESGPWARAYARAVEILIAHHADGPLVAGTALLLQDSFSPERERFIRGLYEMAKSRPARGTATLALAQYLERKASFIPRLRSRAARMPYWTEEFEMQMRAADPEALKAEAEHLLEQVIAEYGDVPYVRGGMPSATERDLARGWTIGRVAEARLDEMHSLAIGKPAPDIEGTDLDGKPLKLGDYRGKVVVLVFWGSWCGPCMAEVPRERELVERLKGRPFALLGVDSDADREAARLVAVRERMTWPSWYDDAPGEGPIAGRYHIRKYPSTFVIDPNGIIRHKDARGEVLGRAVDELLDEWARPIPGPGTSNPGPGKSAASGP